MLHPGHWDTVWKLHYWGKNDGTKSKVRGTGKSEDARPLSALTNCTVYLQNLLSFPDLIQLLFTKLHHWSSTCHSLQSLTLMSGCVPVSQPLKFLFQVWFMRFYNYSKWLHIHPLLLGNLNGLLITS